MLLRSVARKETLLVRHIFRSGDLVECYRARGAVFSGVEAPAGGLLEDASVDHARHIQLLVGCAVCFLSILKYHK